MLPIISVVGAVKSGKTSLIEELVRELKLKGYKVGTLKHTSHTFEFDKPGKDSHRLKVCGSDIGGIFSKESIGIIRDINDDRDFLKIVLNYFSGMDILLIEGYKKGKFPKILMLTSRDIEKEVADFDRDEIIALAGIGKEIKTDFNYFGKFEIKKIAEFLEKNFIKKNLPSGDKKKF